MSEKKKKNLQSVMYWFCWLILAILLVYVLFSFGKRFISSNQNSLQYIYALSKDKKSLQVVSSNEKKVIKNIDFGLKEGKITLPFTSHSFIFSVDKKQLFVVVSIIEQEKSKLAKTLHENGDQHIMSTTDQILVIDMQDNKIYKRIPVGVGLQLAHIVQFPDQPFVYVTAEKGNAVYKIDMKNYKVDSFIQLPPESYPHEIAFSTDRKKLFTKNSKTETVAIISLANDKSIDLVTEKDIVENLAKWSTHQVY